MHILAAVIGIVGALFFWWYRIKAAGEIAGEVVDKAGRARGWFRRRKLRRQAAESPILAIDSPVFAAATLMYALYCNGENSDACQELIGKQVREITNAEEAEEARVYAKWAMEQVPDRSLAINHLGMFLSGKLKADEKRQFMDMIDQGLAACEMESQSAGLKARLADRLGI